MMIINCMFVNPRTVFIPSARNVFLKEKKNKIGVMPESAFSIFFCFDSLGF